MIVPVAGRTETEPTSQPAAIPPPAPQELPEPFSFKVKRVLLGPPLTTSQLSEERLSRPLALGVLAPDMISSSAYGTEEMLVYLLPFFGAAAFALLLPITAAVLFVLIITMLSYREVVTVYTRAGGSYVVARENFGYGVAQVAAVALLIDYIVTVAVQTSAGTAAVVSYPTLSFLAPYSTWITVGVVVALCYGNLRGLREAGRMFAFPTYFFVFTLGLTVIIGLVELATGHLHAHAIPHNAHNPVISISNLDSGHGIVYGLAIYNILRSFANGGSSLTGLEAVSNGVSAFRPPTGVNARRTLVIMCTILGSLVLGVSILTHVTHAVPYVSGTPTVVSQVARYVLGKSLGGRILFVLVQAASMLILYTGANTSFNGFPFLASFVADDQFLPRQLTHRGHRLAFSNGIIVLAAVSIALIVATNAKVNALIAFYAIGVFTGFTMAGAGLSRHHLRVRERHWRAKLAINGSSAVLSAIVVLIFAVTKFTSGAWLVVALFPILVYALNRLNREYREEADAFRSFASALDAAPNYRRHVVLVCVDNLDVATLRALRYARSLRPTAVRAVHAVLDAQRAERMTERWRGLGRNTIPLELLDCPDRRLGRAIQELVYEEVRNGVTEVTVLLPRRSYSPIAGRLLHDRTADRIARVVSGIPNAAATIVPFDPRQPPIVPKGRPMGMEEEFAASRGRTAASPGGEPAAEPAVDGEPVAGETGPGAPSGTAAVPVAGARYRERALVEGRIRSVEVRSAEDSQYTEAVLGDATGGISLIFYGREPRGVEPGRRMRAEGMVSAYEGHLAIRNPRLELLPEE
jgi:amino acid transporter